MSGRLRRIGGEAIRFSAVNALATAVALVIFNMLVHGIKGWFDGPFHAHAPTSYLIANSVGMVISYVGSRRYAFRHRHVVGPGGGLVTYIAINLASFVIPISCLWVTRNVFGWDTIIADNVSANVIGSGFAMVIRFWAFRRFVFRKQDVFWQGQPQHVLPDDVTGEQVGTPQSDV